MTVLKLEGLQFTEIRKEQKNYLKRENIVGNACALK